MVLNSILSGVPHPLMSSTSKVLPEYVPRRPVDLSRPVLLALLPWGKNVEITHVLTAYPLFL